MPKKSLLSLLVLLLVTEVWAQHPDDEYYPYAEREEYQPMLRSDTTLFYRAVQSGEELYGRLTDFNLPQVAIRRRATHFSETQTLLSGVEVGRSYLNSLRLLGAEEVRLAGYLPEAGVAGGLGDRYLTFGEQEALMPYQASVRFSDRSYLFGARVVASGALGRGWYLGGVADFRTGRDLHVEGVYTQALSLALRLEKRFRPTQRLAVMLLAAPSLRGTRLSSVEEAFTLTGDYGYNPAWGFQQGRVRNSRVRRDWVPQLVATYDHALSDRTSLAVALSGEIGVERYSALGWYDARTPMPDNYRYLPSYTGDRASEEAWRREDARYTQIDWDELIRQNRMAGGEAVYALEDRVERPLRVQMNATFTSHLSERLSLYYGLYARYDDRRHYKQMRDLLGAEYLTDIDLYLVDDDTYSNLLQNDLRHPNRRIGQGSRFSYDYSLCQRAVGVQLHASYRASRLRAELFARFGAASVLRVGHYEKELFPGEGSYGRSRVVRFAPYSLRGVVGWVFSPRHYLELSAVVEGRTPSAEYLFYQPLYNNRTVERPSLERNLGVELAYRLRTQRVELQLHAFASMRTEGLESLRTFDDLSAQYCDVAIAGIGVGAFGLEAAAEVHLSYRWSLSLAASAGRYRYLRDPRITLLSDVDNSPIDLNAVSHMGGCRIGCAPEYTAFAGVNYWGAKGWGLRLSAGYVGGRYATPSPLRRTDRFVRQAATTPEALEAFTRQEHLKDALTLDASLFKSFYFDHSRLTLSLMARNLLGYRDWVYSAYESMRIQRVMAGDEECWTPHATKRTYAYPRTFYLSISYRF